MLELVPGDRFPLLSTSDVVPDACVSVFRPARRRE
jgi:hypothetical protein